jgi:hypothetical protein
LAATMLNHDGIAFDPATAWDERKQLFKSSGPIIRTSNVAQSAEETRTAPGHHSGGRRSHSLIGRNRPVRPSATNC